MSAYGVVLQGLLETHRRGFGGGVGREGSSVT